MGLMTTNTPADIELPALPSSGRFTKKLVTVEAAQWLKNGDHPLDYSKDHKGLEGGELRTFTAAERKANDWAGDIVRYFRHPYTPGEKLCKHCGIRMHEHGWIDTLEGGHIVCPGDWIITGTAGEHYPCKPHIFAAIYEPADRARTAANCAGWVSVADRLPEKNTEVLIAFAEQAIASTGQRTESKHDQDGWCYPSENRFTGVDGADPTITHWMPLPATPGAPATVRAERTDAASVADTLERFSKWRRDGDDVIEQPHPSAISEALDKAVAMLRAVPAPTAGEAGGDAELPAIVAALASAMARANRMGISSADAIRIITEYEAVSHAVHASQPGTQQ
jgi:hypothetical protein